MSHRTIEWVEGRLHERLVGANWYRSTEVRDGQIVVRVTSVENARKYGPGVFYNHPVVYEMGTDGPHPHAAC